MRLLFQLPVLLATLALTSCQTSRHSAAQAPLRPWPTGSYWDVHLEEAHKAGRFPYVLERSSGKKRLVVVGTMHGNDPKDERFALLHGLLAKEKPQVILHESQTPASPGATLEEAIRRNGEIGLVAYYARQAGAKAISGDAPTAAEFRHLLQRYSVEEVLVFLVTQRMLGAHPPEARERELADDYSRFVENDLKPGQFPLAAVGNTWSDFKRVYFQVLKQPFNMATLDRDMTSTVRFHSRFAEISRWDNFYRDQWLLDTVLRTLQKEDRVMVVFGGAHVMVIEPALDEVMRRAVRIQ